jgi:hypothetical protein
MDADKYEAKKKEVEAITAPVFSGLYGGGGGGGGAAGAGMGAWSKRVGLPTLCFQRTIWPSLHVMERLR